MRIAIAISPQAPEEFIGLGSSAAVCCYFHLSVQHCTMSEMHHALLGAWEAPGANSTGSGPHSSELVFRLVAQGPCPLPGQAHLG